MPFEGMIAKLTLQHTKHQDWNGRLAKLMGNDFQAV